MLSFHRCLQFWKIEKVSGTKSGEYDGLGMKTNFFWPTTHAQTPMCKMEHSNGTKSMIVFSTILCASVNLLQVNGT